MAAERPSPLGIARSLMREARCAALATLEPGGGPFASYVTVAASHDNSPLLLLSRLAAHTRNLRRDPRASLLLVREPPQASQRMAAERLTLTGRVLADGNPQAERLFLAANPDAAHYLGFSDFAVYRFAVEAGHLVAGFGVIQSIAAADLIAVPGESPAP